MINPKQLMGITGNLGKVLQSILDSLEDQTKLLEEIKQCLQEKETKDTEIKEN